MEKISIYQLRKKENLLGCFTYVKIQLVSYNMLVLPRMLAADEACMNRNKSNTGIYKYFMDGCPTHMATGNVQHLVWTFIEFIETSDEILNEVDYIGGLSCRCSECQR